MNMPVRWRTWLLLTNSQQRFFFNTIQRGSYDSRTRMIASCFHDFSIASGYETKTDPNVVNRVSLFPLNASISHKKKKKKSLSLHSCRICKTKLSTGCVKKFQSKIELDLTNRTTLYWVLDKYSIICFSCCSIRRRYFKKNIGIF